MADRDVGRFDAIAGLFRYYSSYYFKIGIVWYLMVTRETVLRGISSLDLGEQGAYGTKRNLMKPER